jgi:uncharacterized protein YjbI with pentapeptide repeats
LVAGVALGLLIDLQGGGDPPSPAGEDHVDCSNPANVESFAEADLASADLAGGDYACADFSGADLFGANLDRALLAGANFTRAFLRRASFVGADVRDADFSEANLAETSFVRADLRGVRMACGGSEESLTRNFTAADFSGLRVENCSVLGGGSFARANFEDADLNGAALAFDSLIGASFASADLEGVVFFGSDGQPRDPAGAIWSNTICPDGTNSDDAGGCEDHLVEETS